MEKQIVNLADWGVSSIFSPDKQQELVLWTQGCSIGTCPDCINKDFIAARDAMLINARQLCRLIKKHQQMSRISGINLMGGEPTDQALPLMEAVIYAKKQLGLRVILYTGFETEEIDHPAFDPGKKAFVELCDIVVTGRFIARLREVSNRHIGSSNQRIVVNNTQMEALADRMRNDDQGKQAEMIISADSKTGKIIGYY